MTNRTSFQLEIDSRVYANAPLRQIDFALQLQEMKELAEQRAARRAGKRIEGLPYARSADFLAIPKRPGTRLRGRIEELAHCPTVEARGIEWLLRDSHADPEMLRTSQLKYDIACAYRVLRWLVTRAARGDAGARELLARIDREAG